MNRVEEKVKQFFIAVDANDWQTVINCFDDYVEADYSSMNGHSAALIKANDLVDDWKAFLPGFTSTHHQLGNMIVKEEGGMASVFSYVTASHHLENEAGSGMDGCWFI